MKKTVSTILILFYVFASFGFGSIHYYCNMSMDSQYNMDSPACACDINNKNVEMESDTCCETGGEESHDQNHSEQPNKTQFVMDCCTIELSYNQADDFVLKINDLQKLINTDFVSNIINAVQFDAANLSDKIFIKTTLLNRNLPLLI